MRWIQALYAAGVPSSGVEALLPCLHTGRMTPEMIERPVSRRHEVDARVTELTGTHDRLDELITTALAHAAGA